MENVHTAAELKMTGNCLKASRPFLSFDMAFTDKDKPHLQLLKELFIQTFGIAKGHPKSQPFFDRVYTFSLIDDKIWFRHYQILPDEDGSLAEIGPRFVLNPIKIFAASFSGQYLHYTYLAILSRVLPRSTYVFSKFHENLLKMVDTEGPRIVRISLSWY